MQVIIVPTGQNAPDGVDYLEINKQPSGAYWFAGSVAVSPDAVIFNNGTFPSAETAKAAAIEWASQQGADVVYLADLSQIEEE